MCVGSILGTIFVTITAILSEKIIRSEDLFSDKCELRHYFFDADGEVPVVHGATSAYDARLFVFCLKVFRQVFCPRMVC